MSRKFNASHKTAEEGLVIFHKFLAKHYDEDWDFRIASASALYIVTKHRNPCNAKYYTNYLWERLTKDYQINEDELK